MFICFIFLVLSFNFFFLFFNFIYFVFNFVSFHILLEKVRQLIIVLHFILVLKLLDLILVLKLWKLRFVLFVDLQYFLFVFQTLHREKSVFKIKLYVWNKVISETWSIFFTKIHKASKYIIWWIIGYNTLKLLLIWNFDNKVTRRTQSNIFWHSKIRLRHKNKRNV